MSDNASGYKVVRQRDSVNVLDIYYKCVNALRVRMKVRTVEGSTYLRTQFSSSQVAHPRHAHCFDQPEPEFMRSFVECVVGVIYGV